MRFCCNSEEFYLDVLKTYLESDKTQSIIQCYEQEDWKNYEINMHSLKSSSRSIGADELSEHAKNMELAIKEGRLSFIHQEHESLLNEYRELLQKIEAGI